MVERTSDSPRRRHRDRARRTRAAHDPPAPGGPARRGAARLGRGRDRSGRRWRRLRGDQAAPLRRHHGADEDPQQRAAAVLRQRGPRACAWLAEAAGSACPTVLAADDGCLILRWVEPGRPSADAASGFGRALAAHPPGRRGGVRRRAPTASSPGSRCSTSPRPPGRSSSRSGACCRTSSSPATAAGSAPTTPSASRAWWPGWRELVPEDLSRTALSSRWSRPVSTRCPTSRCTVVLASPVRRASSETPRVSSPGRKASRSAASRAATRPSPLAPSFRPAVRMG